MRIVFGPRFVAAAILLGVVPVPMLVPSAANACGPNVGGVFIEPVVDTMDGRPSPIVLLLGEVKPRRIRISAEIMSRGVPVVGTARTVEQSGVVETPNDELVAVVDAPIEDPLDQGAYAERITVSFASDDAKTGFRRIFYRYFEVIGGQTHALTSTEYSSLTADTDEFGFLKTSPGPAPEPGRAVIFTDMVRSGDTNASGRSQP